MKKILSMLLVVVMLMSMLCACGNKTEEPKDPTNTPTQNVENSEPTEDITPSDPSEEVTEPEEDDEEEEEVKTQEELEVEDRLGFETFLASVVVASLNDDLKASMMTYVAEGNVSSYVDNMDTTQYADDVKIPIGCCAECDHYTFGDAARTAEAIAYSAAGNMLGFTVTMKPETIDGVRCYVVANGEINKFILENDTVVYQGEKPDYSINGTIGTLANEALYDAIISIAGEIITIQSEKYQNAPVTAFFYVTEAGTIQANYQYGGIIVEA